MAPGSSLDAYRAVWCVDFEFSAPPGERPSPVCLVARELRSGETIRLWQDELLRRQTPPYPTDSGVLFVAYYASAELNCHLALGWPLPERILDLYVEFRNETNGLLLPGGAGILGALGTYGLTAIDCAEKEAMRQLVIRGEPWSACERSALLDYCETDVNALARLLPRMLPRLDLPRAVACRGRYMSAVARMEHSGVPIDMELLSRLRDGWESIKDRLIEEINPRFCVYEGRTFKRDRWESWLATRRIAWPRLDSGALALDDSTFREMARSHPDIALIHELRQSLSNLKLNDLSVGSDGRNRLMLSPFGARTGRNTASNTKFVFGPAVWLRALIKPEEGRAIAYVDWSQQEFGIAAYLSGDPNMIQAYESGDPYITFGKQAGRIPAEGTKLTHPGEREQFKACVLGVQYGMGSRSLAQRIERPEPYAVELLRLHRATYPRFWAWSEGAGTQAMLTNSLQTVFGWTIHVGSDPNPRSLRNFPCQANGAEMLRLACSRATEQGLSIIAPVHDALLVEGPADDIEAIVARTQESMASASAVILGGPRLRSDAKIVAWPDRYMDDRGRAFFERVIRLLSA